MLDKPNLVQQCRDLVLAEMNPGFKTAIDELWKRGLDRSRIMHVVLSTRGSTSEVILMATTYLDALYEAEYAFLSEIGVIK